MISIGRGVNESNRVAVPNPPLKITSGDAEAHSGELGSICNERAYRLVTDELRKMIWDPLRGELGNARQVIMVPDAIYQK